MGRGPRGTVARRVTVFLRPVAVADIAKAREYYADRVGSIDHKLAEDLDRLFARLTAFPKSAPVVDGYPSIRRAVLRRFPHAVFYALTEPDRIEVLRVLHTSRSTDSWPP